MSSVSPKRDMIPRNIAERSGVNVTKVLMWIASGELQAYNVAAPGKRARWRITEEAYEAFKRKRSNVEEVSLKPKRRKARSVKQFV